MGMQFWKKTLYKKNYITISFLSIHLLKELWWPFHLTYLTFITFSLDYFFNSSLCLNCFLQFFFTKRPNNFFSIKILYYTRPQNSIFNWLNHKNVFIPIRSGTFCKNISIFWYYYMVITFKFKVFIAILNTKVSSCVEFISISFILIVKWYTFLH